ncbi:hypothetical protein [Myroides odoratus]|uniref:hypothetical protein n=1 Tax=Myroides odoratus TaxID=256 RepID=UPI0039AF4799
MRYLRAGIIIGFGLWCVVLLALMFVNFLEMREPFCPEYIPPYHFFLILSISAFLPYTFLFVMNGIERKNKTKQFRITTKLYLGTLLLFTLGCIVDYII